MNLIDFEKKLCIYVCTYNRPEITRISVNNLNNFKGNSTLHIIDDNSNRYDRVMINFLENNSIFERRPRRSGINNLRRYQINHFINSNFEYCYLTDNDTIHDPNFITVLFDIYKKYSENIISLFNSKYHWAVISESDDCTIKTSAPGISIFFNKSLGRKIVEVFNTKYDMTLSWDWNLSKIFERYIFSKQSYVEHIGLGGLTKGTLDWNKIDTAINPTDYLISEKQRIMKSLKAL